VYLFTEVKFLKKRISNVKFPIMIRVKKVLLPRITPKKVPLFNYIFTFERSRQVFVFARKKQNSVENKLFRWNQS